MPMKIFPTIGDLLKAQCDPRKAKSALKPLSWTSQRLHAEHHLFMWVNSYKLPALHEKLSENGMLDRMVVAPGYIAVLREATGRDAG
ncbi:hypothetical protein [Brevundimonas sp. TWP2-3-4b2]|uniref:hypothetical protein n=1 Tax=Brevundimonas sp. TWP2-3-4b2 TaxID=2804595 RepID=UPI003CFA4953